jgi:trimethylamine--corrinoid protein Co-methyltransferase
VDGTASGAISQLTNADMMCGAGLLYGARIFSFEQLLMDCEIFDMLRAVTQGVEVNEETLALDTIHNAGPQSHFLSTKHTKKHMRDIWQPKIMDRRSSWEEWTALGQPAPKERARELVKQLLSEHEPEALACTDDIRKVISEFEKM